MSTDVMIAGNVMATDSFTYAGPYDYGKTENLTPGGPDAPRYDRAEYDVTSEGTSPHGGITYIDQAVGGEVGHREDAAAGPTFGIRSYRMRTRQFDGSFIGAKVIRATRDQGYVGRQDARSTQRALMRVSTDLPDRGDVVAGFGNPALSALIQKIRGDG